MINKGILGGFTEDLLEGSQKNSGVFDDGILWVFNRRILLKRHFLKGSKQESSENFRRKSQKNTTGEFPEVSTRGLRRTPRQIDGEVSRGFNRRTRIPLENRWRFKRVPRGSHKTYYRRTPKAMHRWIFEAFYRRIPETITRVSSDNLTKQCRVNPHENSQGILERVRQENTSRILYENHQR